MEEQRDLRRMITAPAAEIILPNLPPRDERYAKFDAAPAQPVANTLRTLRAWLQLS
jgi:hypothetical protein